MGRPPSRSCAPTLLGYSKYSAQASACTGEQIVRSLSEMFLPHVPVPSVEIILYDAHRHTESGLDTGCGTKSTHGDDISAPFNGLLFILCGLCVWFWGKCGDTLYDYLLMLFYYLLLSQFSLSCAHVKIVISKTEVKQVEASERKCTLARGRSIFSLGVCL